MLGYLALQQCISVLTFVMRGSVALLVKNASRASVEPTPHITIKSLGLEKALSENEVNNVYSMLRSLYGAVSSIPKPPDQAPCTWGVFPDGRRNFDR